MTLSLRAVEPEDIDFIMVIENNQKFWKVSETTLPFSRYHIKQYIENAHQDIFTTKQFRFIINNDVTKNKIGIIDLYDFDPQNKRVGIGIVILEEEQGNGYAKIAIKLIKEYAKNHLKIHQLFVKIHSTNITSLKLFQVCEFEKTAVLKNWYFNGKDYEDEIMMQYFIKY